MAGWRNIYGIGLVIYRLLFIPFSVNTLGKSFASHAWAYVTMMTPFCRGSAPTYPNVDRTFVIAARALCRPLYSTACLRGPSWAQSCSWCTRLTSLVSLSATVCGLINTLMILSQVYGRCSPNDFTSLTGHLGDCIELLEYSVFSIINILFGFLLMGKLNSITILNITFRHHSANHTSRKLINIRISLSIYLWVSMSRSPCCCGGCYKNGNKAFGISGNKLLLYL